MFRTSNGSRIAMNNARWKTAVHEAGHAVACVILGGRCDGIGIEPEGGGYANCTELSPSFDAFTTAAGPEAEYLSAEIAPPDIPSPSLSPVPLPSVGVDDLAHARSVLARAAFLRSPPDDVRLAEWAISGRADDPDCWAGRVRFARHTASKIVADHRDTILSVARELFARGVLSKSEILEAMQ